MHYVVVSADKTKDIAGTVISFYPERLDPSLKERIESFRVNGQVKYEGENTDEAKKVLSQLRPFSDLSGSDLEKWLDFYFSM